MFSEPLRPTVNGTYSLNHVGNSRKHYIGTTDEHRKTRIRIKTQKNFLSAGQLFIVPRVLFIGLISVHLWFFFRQIHTWFTEDLQHNSIVTHRNAAFQDKKMYEPCAAGTFACSEAHNSRRLYSFMLKNLIAQHRYLFPPATGVQPDFTSFRMFKKI